APVASVQAAADDEEEAASPEPLDSASAAGDSEQRAQPGTAPDSEPEQPSHDGHAASKAAGERAASSPKQDDPGANPGKLTINCKPAGDQVSADGIPLGPSPVFNRPLAPGQHRVTCKRGSKVKTIAVLIVAGQLTSKTVRMD